MQYARKIILDILIFTSSFIIAFLIRFDLSIPPDYLKQMWIALPVVVLIRLYTAFSFKIYNDEYKYFSIPNVLSVLKALSISSGLLLILVSILPSFFHIPRSILIIDWLLAFVAVCGIRFIIRNIRQEAFRKVREKGRRALIIGASDTAESILREIRTYNHYNYFPVGLIDDNPGKQGIIIQGVKVLGTSKALPKIVKDKAIEALIIAIPSASKKQISHILSQCRKLSLKILTVPSLCEINDRKLIINQLQEIKPEDILFRKQVRWNGKKLTNAIRGKKIMVTGAGGSIGSELCRQISKHQPEKLILFERSEYNLFCIDKEISSNFPDLSFHSIIADVTDFSFTLKLLKTYKPDIIFHAAAYKHVDLVERNPEIAVKNNVIGTINIAQAAMKAHVNKLVLISTDKAVYPTSIMGATKRICEEYIRTIANMNGNHFFGVRFGNVLGSSGSVLQIFKDQVAAGGPLTITHTDASRYFMTIPEAVHLVLHTIIFGEGGEIFILDMGKPVRIYDLAKKIISMSGLQIDEDIKIKFTGLRPGEKLSEALFEKNEQLEATPHRKILKIKNNNHTVDLAKLKADTLQLNAFISDMNRKAMFQKIKELVPTFQSSALQTAHNPVAIGSIN